MINEFIDSILLSMIISLIVSLVLATPLLFRLNTSNQLKLEKIATTVLALILVFLGFVSTTLAYNIVFELLDLGFLQNIAIDDSTNKIIESKLFDLLIEVVFAVGFISIGSAILKRGSIRKTVVKPIWTKKRKLAYFQSQFGFGLLVVAILFSFSIQSLNDDREFFAVFWGILAVAGVATLAIYRDKTLKEIFDDKHDLFD